MKTELTIYKIAIIDDSTGNIIVPTAQNIETFLTTIIRKVDHSKVIECLLNSTSYIVMLVRQRIAEEDRLKNIGINATAVDDEQEDVLPQIGNSLSEEEYKEREEESIC